MVHILSISVYKCTLLLDPLLCDQLLFPNHLAMQNVEFLIQSTLLWDWPLYETIKFKQIGWSYKRSVLEIAHPLEIVFLSLHENAPSYQTDPFMRLQMYRIDFYWSYNKSCTVLEKKNNIIHFKWFCCRYIWSGPPRSMLNADNCQSYSRIDKSNVVITRPVTFCIV